MLSKTEAKFHSLALLLVLIVIFNTLDYVATQRLVISGGCQEGNPLLRGMINTPYFPAVKLGFVPLGLWFLWIQRQMLVPKYLGLIKITCGCYALLMFYILLIILI